MNIKVELESILSSNQEYHRLIHGFLSSVSKAKDRNTTLKNIILFCKNSISITTKPLTKQLVLRVHPSLCS